MSDIVITWLLTSSLDPQRAQHWPADVTTLDTLRASVARHDRQLIVFHDCLEVDDDEHTTFLKVPAGGNPYWYRWRLVRDHLRGNLGYGFVWCVDGSDTEMLNDPFPAMQPGVLYVGSEGKPLGESAVNAWMRGGCPSVEAFLDAHPDLPVVNVGTVGGDRFEVLTLATRLAHAEIPTDAWEMGAFQRIVYDWHGPVVSGLTVTTPFNTGDRTGPSWWRHK